MASVYKGVQVCTSVSLDQYILHVCHSSQEQRIGPWKSFLMQREQIGVVKKMGWCDHVDVTPPFSHGAYHQSAGFSYHYHRKAGGVITSALLQAQFLSSHDQ